MRINSGRWQGERLEIIFKRKKKMNENILTLVSTAAILSLGIASLYFAKERGVPIVAFFIGNHEELGFEVKVGSEIDSMLEDGVLLCCVADHFR